MIVKRLSEPEACARRAEIIQAAGGDEANFRERAANYLLDSRERALFDELQDLDFLLAP